MERKIGEIFEYNGEWYQTVKSQGKCCSCDFMIDGHCIVDFSSNGSCFYCHRKDNENVIFKKLVKLGNPYVSNGKSRQKYKLHAPFVLTNDLINEDIVVDDENGIVDIRIGQKEEDMEDKKEKLDRLVDDYVACRITYNQFDDEMKAMYAGEKERESVTAEFDLEAAKAGKPVCTRDGRKARIICFNRIDSTGLNLPIVALIQCEGTEVLQLYRNDGKRNVKVDLALDLMMLPEKKEGWVNLYDDIPIYDTKEEALSRKSTIRNLIDAIKVSWEE